MVKNIFTVLIIIFSFSGLINVKAETENNEERKNNLITDGLAKILNHEYSAADSIFNLIRIQQPNESIGLILQAANLVTFAIDFHIKPDIKRILTLLEQAEKINDDRFQKTPDKEYELNYEGMISGIKAFAYYEDKNFFNAIFYGLNSAKTFDKLLRIDNSNSTALIAGGIFKYWRSRKSEFLKFLPFIKDESQEGIEMLTKGLAKESYFYVFGSISFSWILLDQKRPQEVINNCNKILKKYPENRFFLWAIARAYEDIDLKQSVFYYNKLLNLVRKAGQNGYNEITIMHILAQKEFALNNYDNALNYLQDTEKVKINKEVYELLKERFERINKLKETIIKIKETKK